MIQITCKGNSAICTRTERLTSGMVGLQCEFVFDEAWDGLARTAVFWAGNQKRDVLLTGDTCTVPWEALKTAGYQLVIGVYGTNAGGTLVIPTVYAMCGGIASGADPSGEESTDPTLPVWGQLQGMIGNLGNLSTASKDNLVAAINEAAKTGGGGGSAVELDTTLTQSGKAADAKAVGDAMANISGVNWLDPEDGEVFILDTESSGGDTPDTNVPVTGISLNKSTLSLTVGNSEVLIADITPDNATNALVNWTTSAPSVATVANDGTVTAVGVGDAVITATSGDTTNGTISASCSVACAEAESGGDTGGDGELDIPSENLMAYYDLREPLNASGQIVDLSGNEVNLNVNSQAGAVITDGYISREGRETYDTSNSPAVSDEYITIDETITVFATISNYERKTTPVIGFGNPSRMPSIIFFQGGVIFYQGQFNNVTDNTQIDTSETYHVLAVSLDVNGNEKIYINGVLKSDMVVKTVPTSGTVRLLNGYQSNGSTKLRLHNAAFYSSVLDDQTVATISSTLKANAGGAA